VGWPEVNAVNRILGVVLVGLLAAVLAQAAMAQSGDNGMREQFQAVIDGLNDNSFRQFHEAIDDNAFAARVFGTRVIADDAKQAFAGNFPQMLESMFRDGFPAPRTEDEAAGEILGTLVSFVAEGSQARAIVRFEGKGFRFTWHAYDLVRGRGGRVQIVDWFDYYQGGWFSELAGNALVRALPGAGPVASVLEMPSPTEGQLFQVGELFKSVRDGNPRRYVQILDGLEEALRQEPFIVGLNFQYWRMLRDPGRLRAAAEDLANTFPQDPRYSLSLAEFYVQARRFDDAIVQFALLENALGIDDGAIRSLKATAAMALGDFERAQEFAQEASGAEPGLELAWWTLLRTRTAAGNYAGATEALTELEDRFGHLLIPQKLQRDRFLKVLIDQQEYKDWRAARDQAG
jgi:hypothetical protein